MDIYENVAWFGGSFSPPTKMHVKVAIEIGKTLASMTNKGRKSCVCIVPVSGVYKKGSVRDKCIRQEQRWALAEAFLLAIKQDNLSENIDFKLLDYEFKSPVTVPTKDSISILKGLSFCNEETNVFIAQGQDNIMAIFARKWTNSDGLLLNKFFMFPRGQASVKEIVIDIIKVLITENSGQKTPAVDIEAALNIVSNTHFVGEGFSDGTSSSKVRSLIQSNKNLNGLEDYVHPVVLGRLNEIFLKDSSVYNDGSCELVPSVGGLKRKTVRRRLRR